MLRFKTEIPVNTLPNGRPSNKTVFHLEHLLTQMGGKRFQYRAMKTKIVVEIIVPDGITSASELGNLIASVIRTNSVEGS